MKYPDLYDSNHSMNYTAVAFSALRRLPWGLREQLQSNGRWSDVVAWAAVAAVEGWREGYDLKQTYNAAQRYIYQALKAEGYRREYLGAGRVGNYIRRETPFREYETEERGFFGSGDDRREAGEL